VANHRWLTQSFRLVLVTIGSMVLKLGESMIVESNVFMMHEGMDGPHNFGVHLKTNDPVNPDLVVNVLSI
jgi:hypothetical protein